jgi:hypothetical protein
LFRTDLTVTLFVALFSLPGIKRPIASAKYFMSSILLWQQFDCFNYDKSWPQKATILKSSDLQQSTLYAVLRRTHATTHIA